jgi:flagellin
MIVSPNHPAAVALDPSRVPGAAGTTFSRLNAGSGLTTSASNSNTITALALAARSQNLDRAQDNISHAVSFTQTQDAYLRIAGKTLNRMSQLAQQAQDPATPDADRANQQDEFGRLQAIFADVASKNFNGESLFSGNDLTVALDANGQALTLPGVDLSSGVYADVLTTNLESPSDASAALSKVQLSITQLSLDHAGIGASQSELNSVADRLAVSRQNLTALTLPLSGAGTAAVAVQSAKEQILGDSNSAIFAQANALPQSALRWAP